MKTRVNGGTKALQTLLNLYPKAIVIYGDHSSKLEIIHTFPAQVVFILDNIGNDASKIDRYQGATVPAILVCKLEKALGWKAELTGAIIFYGCANYSCDPLNNDRFRQAENRALASTPIFYIDCDPVEDIKMPEPEDKYTFELTGIYKCVGGKVCLEFEIDDQTIELTIKEDEAKQFHIGQYWTLNRAT